MSFLAEIFVYFLTSNLLSEPKWQWSWVDHLVQTQLNNSLNIISLSLNGLETCQYRPRRMSFSSPTHGFISGVKDGSSSSCYHGTEETQGSIHSKGTIRYYTHDFCLHPIVRNIDTLSCLTAGETEIRLHTWQPCVRASLDPLVLCLKEQWLGGSN